MCFNQLSFSSITDLGLRGNKTAAKIAFWLGRPWSTETTESIAATDRMCAEVDNMLYDVAYGS